MTVISRFNFPDDKKITAQVADQTDNFIWIAFAQNASGNCIIEKAGGFNPKQTYFSLDRAVTEVTQMVVNSTRLYVAYNDSSLLGEIISKNNPITSTTDISKPAGITENPVDVLVDTNLYFLLPGSDSGEVTKILEYNSTNGTLLETIELSKSGAEVNNASSFAIDSNDNIWVVTNENPSRYIRVYEDSLGWDFTIHDAT